MRNAKCEVNGEGKGEQQRRASFGREPKASLCWSAGRVSCYRPSVLSLCLVRGRRGGQAVAVHRRKSRTATQRQATVPPTRKRALRRPSIFVDTSGGANL
jgi:hypothetical protein